MLFLGAKRARRVRRSAWAGVGTGTGDAVAGSGCLLPSAVLGRSPTEQALCAAGPWRAARASAKPCCSPHQESPSHSPRATKKMAVLCDMEGKETTPWGAFPLCFHGLILTRRAAEVRLDRARMACFTWASRHPGPCHSLSSASWLSLYPQVLHFA